ncbi:MAG: 23S rRNA (adenine(2503)-C(2))-methyltransferase RlmN [Planctomycetota bacterium]
MHYIKDLSFEELGIWLDKHGEYSYRARQIFYWLYQKAVSDFGDMTDLGISLRNKLQDRFDISSLQLIRKLVSAIDNTQKYLLKLNDKNTIESVVMPYERRCTICISTQVGCRFHCVFCASGKRGLVRNLSPAEIVEQVIVGKQQGNQITNIVFMGMGEPLDNLDNVMKAILLFNDPNAFNIGARRITISTCGIPEGIEKLISLNLQIELSVSLHGAIDEVRNRLMPINKKYPLPILIKKIKEYINKTNRQVTFEYTLINGINSSDKDALALAKLIRGIDCKVNLIPFNTSTVMKTVGNPVSLTNAKKFQFVLERKSIKTTIRHSRGSDIQAACGQLSLNNTDSI